MTARNIAAKQLQALITLRDSKKRPDPSLDHMIRNIQVRYGWVGTKKVAVNEPARNVRPLYRKSRTEVMALVRPY